MKFEVSEEQHQKIERWLNDVVIPHLRKKKPKAFRYGDQPYYGAIGGGLTYSFTPTGLGEILVVTEALSKMELNLTDYDSW